MKPKFEIGEYIDFNHFGVERSGKIVAIGKYGYWVKGPWSGYLRCPFESARKDD